MRKRTKRCLGRASPRKTHKSANPAAQKAVALIRRIPPTLIPIFRMGDSPRTLELEFRRKDGKTVLTTDFNPLIQALGCSKKRTGRFIHSALERMAGLPLECFGIPEARAALSLGRRYLDPQDELLGKIERQTLLAYLRESRFDLIRNHFYGKKEAEELHVCRTLYAFIARLKKLGVKDSALEKELFRWLEKNAKDTLSMQDLLAVVGGVVYLKGNLGNETQLSKVLEEKYLPLCWMKLLQTGDIPNFVLLGHAGLFQIRNRLQENRGQPTFFRKKIVELLAQGQAGLAFQLSVLLGRELGLDPEDAEAEQGRPAIARRVIDGMAWDALSLAYEQGRFGIAAAIAEEFDCLTGLDQEAKALATKALGKSVPEDEFQKRMDQLQTTLKAKREKAIGEAADYAQSLGQSRKLEWCVYLGSTDWSKW